MDESTKALVDAVVAYLERRDSIERDGRYPERMRHWAAYMHPTTRIRDALRGLGVDVGDQPWATMTTDLDALSARVRELEVTLAEALDGWADTCDWVGDDSVREIAIVEIAQLRKATTAK